MTVQPFTGVLTAPETAAIFGVTLSWLAKARMRGDGPAYIKVGQSIRYSEVALQQWIRSRQLNSDDRSCPQDCKPGTPIKKIATSVRAILVHLWAFFAN